MLAGGAAATVGHQDILLQGREGLYVRAYNSIRDQSDDPHLPAMNLEASIWLLDHQGDHLDNPARAAPLPVTCLGSQLRTALVCPHQGALAPRASRWLPTDAGDLLRAEVLQQGVDGRVLPGVQLIPVDANVEFEPVRIEVHGCFASRQEFCSFSTFLWPTRNKDRLQSSVKREARGRGMLGSWSWGSRLATLGSKYRFTKSCLCTAVSALCRLRFHCLITHLEACNSYLPSRDATDNPNYH